MSPDDRLILESTAITPTTLMCPLHCCAWHIEVPPIDRASEKLANLFGMSGATFDQLQAENIAAEKADEMRRHLATHTPEQWLQFATYLTEAARTGLPLAFAVPLERGGLAQ